jgi:hypothetical protein
MLATWEQSRLSRALFLNPEFRVESNLVVWIRQLQAFHGSSGRKADDRFTKGGLTILAGYDLCHSFCMLD